MSRWHHPRGWRQRLARRLSFLADRIDPDGAPRALGWAFTREDRGGLVWRDGRTQGCPVWHLGKEDYDRAFTEADRKAIRVDWETMKIVQRPGTCTPGGYDIGSTVNFGDVGKPVPHIDQQEVDLGPHSVDVRVQGGPWTRHGHAVDGVTVEGPGRPPVARCGGPAICSQCALDAASIRRAAGCRARRRADPIGTETVPQ
jgi:hypothetical protein